MKKILTVFTGGTICCASDESKRYLNPALAKRALLANFAESNSPYAKIAGGLFEDSEFPEGKKTLSENMTAEKLDFIAEHVLSFNPNDFAGIIILHGTDTLAFSASVLSRILGVMNLPVMLVSGNHPPMDKKSNANANFRKAVELIMGRINPGVYVPYRNSDGEMHLHHGEKIMQCGNFSEDFFSEPVLGTPKRTNLKKIRPIPDNVLVIYPYTGLNYSRFDLSHIKAVIHGTYHSGTVCTDKLIPFAARCCENHIPLFIAPSGLGSDQYASVFELTENSSVHLMNTSLESAYGKALAGIAFGFQDDELTDFMLNG